MNPEEEEPENEEEASPDEVVTPPPPTLRPETEGPEQSPGGIGSGETADRSRSHPLDPYAPLKQRGGCKKTFGCFFGGVAILVVLFLVLVFAVAKMGPGKHLFSDYEVVHLEEAEAVITTPPDRPTCYFGQTIEYRATVTETSIAIVGTDVTVSGIFFKDLSVTAAKFKATSSTRISGNLEVYAAEFYDEGIDLRGELSGSVMNNMHP